VGFGAGLCGIGAVARRAHAGPRGRGAGEGVEPAATGRSCERSSAFGALCRIFGGPRAAGDRDPAQPCCLGGTICPQSSTVRASPRRPSKNLRSVGAPERRFGAGVGVGRLPGSTSPAAWPSARPNRGRLNKHRTPSGAVVIVERRNHGRTRGPRRPTRSSFLRPQAPKGQTHEDQSRARRSGGPGARATTLLTSPGPDRATANRPAKPGGPRAPGRVGRVMPPSRHTIRPTPS
jgi:hypothetical protein